MITTNSKPLRHEEMMEDNYKDTAAAPATKAPTNTTQLAPILTKGEAELVVEVPLGAALLGALDPVGLTVMVEVVMVPVPVGAADPEGDEAEGVLDGVPLTGGDPLFVLLAPPPTIWPSLDRYEGGAL